MKTTKAIVALAATIGAVGVMSVAWARQQASPEQAPEPISGAESRERFSPDQLTQGLGQQVVAGLKATPGCLGAEAASFHPNKLAIFGWFEDKRAALAWHSSALHRNISARFAGGRTMHNIPMEHVQDGVPLMVIASVVMQPADPGGGGGMPRMFFGIEVYEPMPGGLSFQGGAFSPPGFQRLIETIRNEAAE
ncbi:MAG: hypothetical protein AAGK04_02990 [Planctomycetota bacterium]